MSYPEKITVSGSITPDWPAGKVMEQLSSPWGPVGGKPVWGTDGYPTKPSIQLLWDTDHWLLYYSLTESGFVAWKRYDTDPIGEYIPSDGLPDWPVGNAFVESLDDYYNVYTGQDGNIDYGTIVATMELDDTEVQILDQDLQPNTIHHYVRRQVRGDCGLEGESSDPCIIHIDENGDMRLAVPNPVTDLAAEAIAGGKIRLRWHYSAVGQEVSPDGFAIFQATSNDFSDTPIALVAGGMAPNNEYAWESDELTDGVYYFMIKTFSNFGGVGQASIITASPDNEGPIAITNLLAVLSE